MAAQRVTESSFSFWANILDGQGDPTLTFALATETGKPISLIIRDRDSLAPLATFQVEMGAATQMGQALMLADAMKMKEEQDRMSGDGGL